MDKNPDITDAFILMNTSGDLYIKVEVCIS